MLQLINDNNIYEKFSLFFQKYLFYNRDYKEYNTDTAIHFIVIMNRDKLIELEKDGLHKAFKLQTTMTVTSMVRYQKY